MVRPAPVFLVPNGRGIVVFGGGPVACRKCANFAEFDITVVAEEPVPEIRDVSSRVIEERFDASDISKYLDGAFMAIAATDSRELNGAIVAEAKRLGVLVNSAHGGGNVLLPSSVRRGGYTVCVSSEGNVPAFPPFLVKKIDASLGPEYDSMLGLLMEVRGGLEGRVPEQPDRARLLARILDEEGIWCLLRQGKEEEARLAAQRLEADFRERGLRRGDDCGRDSDRDSGKRGPRGNPRGLRRHGEKGPG